MMIQTVEYFHRNSIAFPDQLMITVFDSVLFQLCVFGNDASLYSSYVEWFFNFFYINFEWFSLTLLYGDFFE